MANELAGDDRKLLLEIAAASIEHGLLHQDSLAIKLSGYAPHLREPRATFVTVRIEEELQGCIGTLRPVRPLAADIARNAHTAAHEDPRGRVLSAADLKSLHIHISLLGKPEPIEFDSQEDLLAKVRPGVDGLILEENGRCGTLLPSVWENLPDAREFVDHLKLKAGLPVNYWSKQIKISRYETESFSN